MEPVTLRSPRLVLSTPTSDDIDLIAGYCRDPLFERWLATPWPYERADAERFVDELVPSWWTADLEYTWAIRAAEAGAPMGVIGWRRRGDVGFWMGAPHRGQGYMAEALEAVAVWAFSVGAPSVTWECFLGNEASARVARAAGFTFTGLGRVLVPQRDGTTPDGWQAVLRSTDDRTPKTGWPL